MKEHMHRQPPKDTNEVKYECCTSETSLTCKRKGNAKEKHNNWTEDVNEKVTSDENRDDANSGMLALESTQFRLVVGCVDEYGKHERDGNEAEHQLDWM